MSTEYILCAAVKRVDERLLQTTYSDLAICEIGHRHCDILERFGKGVSSDPHDQGFFTSKGRFVGREEAMKVAYIAGQVTLETALKDPNGASIKKEYEPDDYYCERPRIIIEGEPVWHPLNSEDLY